jgi:hypothetical protein
MTMQLFLFIALLLTMTGCSQKKWDKETLVNDCLADFTKKNEEEKIFTQMQLAHICDCLAERMLVKYKSANEADKDEEGMTEMGRACAMDVMEKAK